MLLSEELRILNQQLGLTESKYQQIRAELRSVKQDSPEHELEDTKMVDPSESPSVDTSLVSTTPSTPLEEKFDLTYVSL